jgi:hypothetical protein
MVLKYASQASKFQKILKEREKKAGKMKKRHGAKEEADKEGRKKGGIGIQLQLDSRVRKKERRRSRDERRSGSGREGSHRGRTSDSDSI